MVEAETEVFGKALVAIRNIPRGESMMKDDVAVQRVRMESGKSYLPPNAETAVGREARRSFKAGEVILASEAPVGDAVKRGSLVVMKTEGRGWDVQSKVKALGAGAVGDIITVEDMNNKTKYPARITGPGTVAVVVRHDPHGVVKKD
jgi:flagella basal body P-ring formation protein FlgA